MNTNEKIHKAFNNKETVEIENVYKPYKEQKTLLSKGNTNAKTSKNAVETYILYLSPYTQNSKKINVCPKASKGCAAACLFTAGRGRMSNVQSSRMNKTEYYLNDKSKFINQLAKEIKKAILKATVKGNDIAFRLNGTSDIDFIYLLKKYADFDALNTPDNVHFYDYTAILGKARKYKGTKYAVTLSRKEDNQSEIDSAIAEGINVSVVFANELPAEYNGAKVLDGDMADDLMLTNKGIVLGLKAKGDAKKDESGFVVK